MSGDARELDVWLGSSLAGRLRATESGDLAFDYDAAYRDSVLATPLSLSLPLTGEHHAPSTVTGFFEGLLPESGPAREQLAAEAGVSRSNLLGLLAYVGRDLPGAVSVLPRGEGLPSDGGVDELSEQELADRVADLRRSSALGSVPLSAHGQWSLAGAQAKLALTHRDGRWGVPYGAMPTTHIIKPAIPGFEHFDAFEVIALRAARLLGLSSAHAWLQPLVDGTHAAVIVRYDRIHEPDGTIRRIHQEDLCQALGYRAWQKYEREGGPGLARIASLLRSLPVPLREDTARRFVDALILNHAIAGTDGHARNFSMLLSGPDAVLAPLYDVNSALPYTRPWGARFTSVSKIHSSFVLGSSDAFTRVGVDDWRAVAAQFGLAVEEVVMRVEEVRDRVPDAFVRATAEVAGDAGLDLAFPWQKAFAAYRSASR